MGETGQNLINDIQAEGGEMTMQDLADYEVEWGEPVVADIGNGLTLHSLEPPSSGVILSHILQILKLDNLTPEDFDIPMTYHHVAEAMKFAYAQRSKLGDINDISISKFVKDLTLNLTSDAWAMDHYSKIDDTTTHNNYDYYGADFQSMSEDHGTAHVSVVAPNGDAVAITSTINTYFGNKFMSPSTGIIMNDEMDDFSYPNETNIYGLPPSVNNYVKPGKRPMSSMCPAVIVDSEGNARHTPLSAW